MSIIVTTLVRERVVPGGTNAKYLLEILASHADDDGEKVFPKLAHVASDMDLGERQARRIVAGLLKAKLLERVREPRGHRPPEYRIALAALCQLPLTASAEARAARLRRDAKTARADTDVPPAKASRADTDVPPGEARADTDVRPGRSPMSARTLTVSSTVTTEGEPSVEGAREATGFALTPAERSPPKRGTRLPEDWQPSERDLAFAVGEGLSEEEARREAAQFRDHWIAASGAKACKRDWSAAWRTWIRNAVKWQRERSRPGGNRRGPASSAEAFMRGAGIDPNTLGRS